MKSNLRTPLSAVRGLGSAKSGLHHWWAQRLTALALALLGLWFVAAIIAMTSASYENVHAWAQSPVSAVLLIALVVALFHHAQLGLQVVIEDYIKAPLPKLAAYIAAKFVMVLLGIAAAIAVLRIAIGGN